MSDKAEFLFDTIQLGIPKGPKGPKRIHNIARFILQFFVSTANPEHTDVETESESCMIIIDDGEFGEAKQSLRIPVSLTAERRIVNLTVHLLSEVHGLDNGFEVIAGVCVPLTFRLENKFLKENNIRICHHNDNLVPQPTDSQSPLTILGQEKTLHAKRIQLSAPDMAQKLHSWQNSDFQVAELSFGLTSTGHLPEHENQEGLLRVLCADQKWISSVQRDIELFYKGFYERGLRKELQYPSLYQQFVPDVNGLMHCHYTAYQLSPANCRTTSDVLICLLRIGCRIHGITYEELARRCEDPGNTQTHEILMDVYTVVLRIGANSIKYQTDYDFRARPSERFTNFWNLFGSMADVGLDSAHMCGDCEDLAFFMCKLHVAFVNYPYSDKLDCSSTESEEKNLEIIVAALSPYVAYPITCATTDISYTDAIAATGKYSTHTCAVLGRIDLFDQLPVHPKKASEETEERLYILEGTALYWEEDKHQWPKDDKTIKTLSADAEKYRVDLSIPTCLPLSNFYRFATQISIKSNDGWKGYILKSTNGTIGVPFDEFLNCRFSLVEIPQPQHPEATAASFRYYTMCSPVVSLQSPMPPGRRGRTAEVTKRNESGQQYSNQTCPSAFCLISGKQNPAFSEAHAHSSQFSPERVCRGFTSNIFIEQKKQSANIGHSDQSTNNVLP